ncbi:autolysin [Bifidobacterium hapali]|uniref:Autolysin n=2 Tax=Bifidobacterium hapali TaxID=1630172 RepID=A0A261G1R4_9BIFI|nr:autolysin [Bifidobacterium hapali]
MPRPHQTNAHDAHNTHVTHDYDSRPTRRVTSNTSHVSRHSDNDVRHHPNRPDHPTHAQSRAHRIMRTWAANLSQSPVYRRRLVTVLGAALAICVAVGGSVHYVWTVAVDESSQAAKQSQTATKSNDADTNNATKHATQVPQAQSLPTGTPTEIALNAIGKLDGAAQVSTTGFTLDPDTQVQLEDELNTFTNAGYEASFVIVDIKTGDALSSYAGIAHYSASAIKGPYVLALAETGAIDLKSAYLAETSDAGNTQYLIHQTISVSNNDTYFSLRLAYGTDAFAQWSQSAGVSVDVTDMSLGDFLNMSSADLARMWAKGYGYLFGSDGTTGSADGTTGSADGSDSQANSQSSPDNTTQEATDVDSAARQWLAGEFSNTLNSSIHMALGSQYSVYTKAGWINEAGLYSLNDAGIVRSSSGDYVLAVMTTAVNEYDMVSGLVSMLDTIHTDQMSA